MNSLKKVTTFNGEVFEPIEITLKRQDGLPGFALYVNKICSKMILATSEGDVVKLFSVSPSGTFNIENP